MRKTLPRLATCSAWAATTPTRWWPPPPTTCPRRSARYLRLPRDWADSRPVEGGKTSLLLLIDQLDLLATTMDAIYDAANTTDAAALISHGRFLQERFGHAQAPELNLGRRRPWQA